MQRKKIPAINAKGYWDKAGNQMLPFDEAEEKIGHAVGGVCPFGVNGGVSVYLDESLRRFDYIYPAAGTRNSAVKLTPAELESASGAKEWICVTKGWGEDGE